MSKGEIHLPHESVSNMPTVCDAASTQKANRPLRLAQKKSLRLLTSQMSCRSLRLGLSLAIWILHMLKTECYLHLPLCKGFFSEICSRIRAKFWTASLFTA